MPHARVEKISSTSSTTSTNPVNMNKRFVHLFVFVDVVDVVDDKLLSRARAREIVYKKAPFDCHFVDDNGIIVYKIR